MGKREFVWFEFMLSFGVYFIRYVSLWKGSHVNSTSFIYAPVKYVIIGSGDVLSPVRITAISWANNDVLLIGYVGINLIEIWNEIQFHLRTCMRKYRLRNVKHSVLNQCFNWQYTSLASGNNLRVDRRPSHCHNQYRPSSLTHICITKSSNNVWEGVNVENIRFINYMNNYMNKMLRGIKIFLMQGRWRLAWLIIIDMPWLHPTHRWLYLLLMVAVLLSKKSITCFVILNNGAWEAKTYYYSLMARVILKKHDWLRSYWLRSH